MLAGIALVAILAPAVAARSGPVSLKIQLLPLILLPLAIASWKRPERFAIAASAIAFYVTAQLGTQSHVLAAERSFFGVVRVVEPVPLLRMMTHGTTVHGYEFSKTPYPIGYYYPDAPITVVTTASA